MEMCKAEAEEKTALHPQDGTLPRYLTTLELKIIFANNNGKPQEQKQQQRTHYRNKRKTIQIKP